MLAAARNPIIITKALGRDPAAVPVLVRLAETLGAPVFDQFHTYVNFPQDHALHGGFEAAPHLAEADADPGHRVGRAVVPADEPPEAGDARRSTWAWTRSSRATRCAASPRTWRWPAPRGWRWPRWRTRWRGGWTGRRWRSARQRWTAAGARRREAAAAKSRAVAGRHAHRHALALPRDRGAGGRPHDRGQRVRSRRDPVHVHPARQLLRGAALGRARVGPGRRARGQAGRARSQRDLLRGRRGLHLRLAHRRRTSSRAPTTCPSCSWSSTTARGTR